MDESVGVFTLAGIIIGSLLGVLILVGGVWNIIKRRRNKAGDNESDDSSDSDSMDLDLANTDLESRMGDMDTVSRPPSRARSYRYQHSYLM